MYTYWVQPWPRPYHVSANHIDSNLFLYMLILNTLVISARTPETISKYRKFKAYITFSWMKMIKRSWYKTVKTQILSHKTGHYVSKISDIQSSNPFYHFLHLWPKAEFFRAYLAKPPGSTVAPESCREVARSLPITISRRWTAVTNNITNITKDKICLIQ